MSNQTETKDRREWIAGGFVCKTKGGFWRGYRRVGIGYGPFSTRRAAVEWVDSSSITSAHISDLRGALLREPTDTPDCDGCSDAHDSKPLSPYTVTHHDGSVSQGVMYCGDCADLAGCDWNGETRGLVAE